MKFSLAKTALNLFRGRFLVKNQTVLKMLGRACVQYHLDWPPGNQTKDYQCLVESWLPMNSNLNEILHKLGSLICLNYPSHEKVGDLPIHVMGY